MMVADESEGGSNGDNDDDEGATDWELSDFLVVLLVVLVVAVILWEIV